MTVTFYNSSFHPSKEFLEAITEFLFLNLEQYGDPKQDISKAMDYALAGTEKAGGFICVQTEEDEITGAVVINHTGMEGYIPENILVYIAIHKNYRGKGFGKLLLREAINRAQGAIALHVEPDNPARFLYKKLGFSHKYMEMRYTRKEVS